MKYLLVVLVVAFATMPVFADELTDAELHTFAAGTPARASEVNENFDAVQGAINDNDARIDALQVAPPSHDHDASDITSGTLSDSRLSSSVSRLGPSIESGEITNGTITGLDIASSSIGAGDLLQEAGMDWQSISETRIDVTSAVNVASVTLSVPASGYVVVRFDGNCWADYGDLIVLAASNTSASWTPNDGNVGVYQHASLSRAGQGFSHTRVYTVSGSGNYTYYAVAHNYVETEGNGIASIYGMLTAQYFPTRY